MKRTLLVTLILVMFGITTQAQQSEIQSKQAQEAQYELVKVEVERLSSALNLTESQVSLMRKNLMNFEANKQEVANSNASGEKKTQKINKLDELKVLATKEFLTESQFSQYTQMSGVVRME